MFQLPLKLLLLEECQLQLLGLAQVVLLSVPTTPE
jgi:hypothetical protein